MPSYLAKRKAEDGTYSAFYLSSTKQAEEALATGFQVYEEGDPEDILLDHIPIIEPCKALPRTETDLAKALKIIMEGGE